MEKVKFTNSRGLNLVGNYWEANSDAAIVMSHGFTGDKTEWGYFDTVAEAMNDSGYNVLAFDFSGSGESDDDTLTVEKEVDDLNSALEYLKSRDMERFGLYGHSLGGLVSIRNYGPDIAAMVLTAPVTDSFEDYDEHRFTDEEIREMEEKGYYTKYRDKGVRDEIRIDEKIVREREDVDQDQLLSGVDCPVLIMHGDSDDIVPIEDSRNAVKKLDTAEIKVLEGLNHDYDTHFDEIITAAEDWFHEHMPR